MKDLIKDLETSTSLEWREHDENGQIWGSGCKYDYWLDISKYGYNLTATHLGAEIVALYGLDLDNVILEVNKKELNCG